MGDVHGTGRMLLIVRSMVLVAFRRASTVTISLDDSDILRFQLLQLLVLDTGKNERSQTLEVIEIDRFRNVVLTRAEVISTKARKSWLK